MYAYVRGISDVQPDSTVQIGAAVCDSEDISFAKAADGRATKLIIPSNIQSIAGLAASLKEVVDTDAKPKA